MGSVRDGIRAPSAFRAAGRGLAAAMLWLAAAAAQDTRRPALDATAGYATVPAHDLQAAVPLTVECFAKLDRKQSYNILIAHETKASATHWELFTQPTSGQLSAYLPGRKPDHVHTGLDIVDSRWHYVAMVLEAEIGRAHV